MISAVFTLMLLSFALFHLCSISLKDLNYKLFSIFEKDQEFEVSCIMENFACWGFIISFNIIIVVIFTLEVMKLEN